MAKMQKMEETFEVKCSAEKIYEMVSAKQAHVSQICSHRVPNSLAHQGDWLSVGSTRKWDFIIGGKPTYIVDRIDSIDENMKISRSVIDGEIMSHYKTMKIHFQPISKGNDNTCLVTYCLEYEKITEDAPEPKEFLNFGVALFKELGDHISSTN